MARTNSIAPSRSGYESVSVRAIDNGYLICRSSDAGYSETYSPTKPKIEVPAAPKGAPKPKAEAAATTALKRAAAGGKKR